MWQLRRKRPKESPEEKTPVRSRRERLAMVFAGVTLACVVSTFVFSKNLRFLMPGPLTSAHGSIGNCSACHAGAGSSKLGWVHRLAATDPLADSKACLTCHKMPKTAFNAHTASADVLKQSTARVSKFVADSPAPLSARVQSIAFPTKKMVADGLACATCHQEHKGVDFKLNKISNEQCRSCHAVKFESFDGHHPKFEDYPFRRRTRIIYDHAGHFAKHYPELAKKDPAKRIPTDCSTCHESGSDKRIIAVVSFDKTCATCHLDQITGKERASGPKGIAFLTLPGLDLETLKKKKAAIGEWPDGSEAALTPFMKVMIGHDEHGRALLKAADALNLQDLTKASDEEIKAVTDLAWEIKRLFHALISGKVSDVLDGATIVKGAKLSPSLVADLTASIPRDVVVSAQQQWLPHLAKEIASGPFVADEPPAEEKTKTTVKSVSAEPDGAGAASSKESHDEDHAEAGAKSSDKPEHGEPADSAKKSDPPPCLLRVLGQCLVSKEQETSFAPAHLGGPVAKASNQKDELLSPTEDELRAIKAHNKRAGGARASPESGSATPNSDAPADASQAKTAPAVDIESGVDSESWAEYGGWYRQDYAIYYRPVGHKDKFVYSWLSLTGPHAVKGEASPASAVFDVLTNKDAQGSCTKCHSIDDLPGKGRVVNFSPATIATKQEGFTRFIHEPHFGLMPDRGCLSCHKLQNGRPYLKSYEQSNPQSFASNFGAVNKETCQTCHNSSKARQDCLTCHRYHVNGVVTPIMNTKLPTE